MSEKSDHEILADMLKRGVLTIETRTLDDGMAGATYVDGALADLISKPNTRQARLVTRWSAMSAVRGQPTSEAEARRIKATAPEVTVVARSVGEWVEGDVVRSAREALLAAAGEIERELICCDEYEEAQVRPLSHEVKHHICYWSAAARAIVLKRAAEAGQ